MAQIKHFFSHLLFLVLLLSAFQSVQAEGTSSSKEDEAEVDINELIDGHVWDSHEYHIMDWNGSHITLALPVILWTDNGLTIFSSSRFKHDTSGKIVVESNGRKFVNYREHIFYADKFDQQKFDEASTLSKPVLYDMRPLDFSITKTVFSIFVGAIIALLIFFSTARAYKKDKKM